MKIGDIVASNGSYKLRSSQRGVDANNNPTYKVYDTAVVVSLEPFKLISEERDRLWYLSVVQEDFKVVGHVDHEMMEWLINRFKLPGYVPPDPNAVIEKSFWERVKAFFN